jgi:hypothetical protein
MHFALYPIRDFTDIVEIRYERLSPNVVERFRFSSKLTHSKTELSEGKEMDFSIHPSTHRYGKHEPKTVRKFRIFSRIYRE